MVTDASDLLPRKSDRSLHIYAYEIDDKAHDGLLKVGQTTRDVATRVSEQLKTAGIKNYTIVLDEIAVRDDGSFFRDSDVRRRLVKKGFENTELEWMRCTVDDVRNAI